MDHKKSSAQQVLQGQTPGSWASIAIDYLDLKARLLALGSKEAVGHFVSILIIVGVTLVLALSSALMYAAFLLYLVALLSHLAWGWSALISWALLTVASLGGFFLLRQRLRRPIFQITLNDIQKGQERSYRTQKKPLRARPKPLKLHSKITKATKKNLTITVYASCSHLRKSAFAEPTARQVL
jgi:uncharacterized membrane protein YqjE